MKNLHKKIDAIPIDNICNVGHYISEVNNHRENCMDIENGGTEIVLAPSDYQVQITAFENGLLTFIASQNLPTDTVFVSLPERFTVFKNVEDVVALLSYEKKSKSIYISKFIAAVASGLFDAALNYLWNETVSELRQRIANYDLPYFFDNAVSNPDKRKGLKTADDLERIDDFELIKGAREIELISDIGYRHLNFIRDMRNHASAAHPNQNEITGLLLIGWLQTCIREVISLSEPHMATKIKTLLARIKTDVIDNVSAEQIATTFDKLTSEQINTLASGFWGIYTRLDTTPVTRENIHKLLPHLWGFVAEDTRQQFGIKYGQFTVNGDVKESRLARQFLELVSGGSYIPNDLRAVEIKVAVENLLHAHYAMQNFYNEPPFARTLQRLIGEIGTVPPQVTKFYVLGLINVYLGNQYGVSNQAVDIYSELIELFDERQAKIAAMSFNDIDISTKLQYPKCKARFYDLLRRIESKISSTELRLFISEIEAYRGELHNLKDNERFKQRIVNLQKIIN